MRAGTIPASRAFVQQALPDALIEFAYRPFGGVLLISRAEKSEAEGLPSDREGQAKSAAGGRKRRDEAGLKP